MRGAIPPFPQYAFMAWNLSLKQRRDNINFIFIWRSRRPASSQVFAFQFMLQNATQLKT